MVAGSLQVHTGCFHRTWSRACMVTTSATWLACVVGGMPCLCRFVAGSGGDAQAETNRHRLKEPCVCVTTFNMIAHKGKRSVYGEEVSQVFGLAS